MNEDFVSFDLAKKLKEKGFSCKMPFAMYNEIAAFHLLTTSAPYNVCDSGFKYREYYDYEDFDEYDYIAPTISQVLKWLREEKKIYLELIVVDAEYMCNIYKIKPRPVEWVGSTGFSEIYESAALAGIEFVLDNLI